MSLSRPMVIVCPRKLSLRDLVVSYFAKHKDEAEQLPIEDIVRSGLIRRRVNEKRERNVAALKVQPRLNPFKDECFGDKAKNQSSSSSKCDFLRQLYAVMETTFFESCNNLQAKDVLVDYATETVLRKMM